jgi:hypothetical protein
MNKKQVAGITLTTMLAIMSGVTVVAASLPLVITTSSSTAYS